MLAEDKADYENYCPIDNSIDKDDRNPACEKVIMLKEKGGQD